MQLKSLQLSGFKSFAQKTILEFKDPIVAIVGPNGSGKSNVVEAIRFVLGEQSIKSLRGKTGGDLIFKGSKKLSSLSRAGVTIYFDNRDRLFKLTNEGGEEINLNFDTVSISREVFPDGVNKYILNVSEIRLFRASYYFPGRGGPYFKRQPSGAPGDGGRRAGAQNLSI